MRSAVSNRKLNQISLRNRETILAYVIGSLELDRLQDWCDSADDVIKNHVSFHLGLFFAFPGASFILRINTRCCHNSRPICFLSTFRVCIYGNTLEIFWKRDDAFLFSCRPLENSSAQGSFSVQTVSIPTLKVAAEAWGWDNTSFPMCSTSRSRRGMTFCQSRWAPTDRVWIPEWKS